MKKPFKTVSEFLRKSKRTLVLIVVVAATTIVLTTIISIWLSRIFDVHVPSIGNIKTIDVKVYWDANLENEAKQIQWSTIYPGSSYNVTVYVQSVSNVKAAFRKETTNWTFTDAYNKIVSGPSNNTSYMYLDWDYNNSTVNAGEAFQITLTLYVDDSSSSIDFFTSKNVRSFSFDIIILALEKD